MVKKRKGKKKKKGDFFLGKGAGILEIRQAEVFSSAKGGTDWARKWKEESHPEKGKSSLIPSMSPRKGGRGTLGKKPIFFLPSQKKGKGDQKGKGGVQLHSFFRRGVGRKCGKRGIKKGGKKERDVLLAEGFFCS